jgi:hypothetical protein
VGVGRSGGVFFILERVASDVPEALRQMHVSASEQRNISLYS